MRSKKILHIIPFKSSFIENDHQILSSNFDTIKFNYVHGDLFRHIKSNLLLLIFFFKNIRNFEIAYVWFADYHSFLVSILCKIFLKKLIIVAGGYDCYSNTELNYGVGISKFRKIFAQISFKYASKILIVSNNAKLNFTKIYGNSNQYKIELLYNGVNLQDFVFLDSEYKRKYFGICVSNANNKVTYLRKGVDKFIEIAKLFPDEKYLFIGNDNFIKKSIEDIPKNITFLGNIEHSEISKFLNDSTYIFQMSIIESFGIAVIEGMLCGCIPVIYNDIATAELIEDSNCVKLNRNDTNEIIHEKLSNEKIYKLPSIIENAQKYDLKNRELRLLQSIYKS